DLLPVDAVVVAALRADAVDALDQERAAAAGGVGDALAWLRVDELGDELADLGGGVELARFLAGAGGEVGDEVLVGVADDVLVADAAGAQVELGVGEVLEQHLQARVSLAGLAEVGFAVEVDVAEDALQLGLVGVLDLLQGLVDELSEVGLVALLLEVVVARALGEDEAFALEAAADALVVVAVALLELGVVLGPDVGDVLEEEHDEQVVLVLAGVDGAAEGVAGAPEDCIDFILAHGGSRRSCHLSLPPYGVLHL